MGKKPKSRKAKADRRKVKQRTHGDYLNKWQFPHKFAENPLNTVYEKLYLLGADLDFINRQVKYAKYMSDLRSLRIVKKPQSKAGTDLVIEEIIKVHRAVKALIDSPLYSYWLKQRQVNDLLSLSNPAPEMQDFCDFMQMLLGQINKRQANSAKPKTSDPIDVLFDALGMWKKRGRGKEKLITWLLGKLVEHLRLETENPHTKHAREIIRIVFKKSISANAAFQRERKFKAMPPIEAIPA